MLHWKYKTETEEVTDKPDGIECNKTKEKQQGWLKSLLSVLLPQEPKAANQGSGFARERQRRITSDRFIGYRWIIANLLSSSRFLLQKSEDRKPWPNLLLWLLMNDLGRKVERSSGGNSLVSLNRSICQRCRQISWSTVINVFESHRAIGATPILLCESMH